MELKNFYPLKEEEMMVFIDYLIENFGSVKNGVKVFPRVMSYGWMSLLWHYVTDWREFREWKREYSDRLIIVYKDEGRWMLPPRDIEGEFIEVIEVGGGWLIKNLVSEEKLVKRLIWLARFGDRILKKIIRKLGDR